MNLGAFLAVEFRSRLRCRTPNCLYVMQDGLRRADEERAAMTEEAKAERHSLEARLRTELLQQEQRNLEAATHFRHQLTVLQEQLEEQQKRVAVKEEQLKKITATKDEQLWEAASSNSALTQVTVSFIPA